MEVNRTIVANMTFLTAISYTALYTRPTLTLETAIKSAKSTFWDATKYSVPSSSFNVNCNDSCSVL